MISPRMPKSSSTPSSIRAFCSSASADSWVLPFEASGSASKLRGGNWNSPGLPGSSSGCRSRDIRLPCLMGLAGVWTREAIGASGVPASVAAHPIAVSSASASSSAGRPGSASWGSPENGEGSLFRRGSMRSSLKGARRARKAGIWSSSSSGAELRVVCLSLRRDSRDCLAGLPSRLGSSLPAIAVAGRERSIASCCSWCWA